MKFNAEKLKAIARPMTPEEKANADFRSENADWLRLSATIALKIRKILRRKGMSQASLAASLAVTPAQVSKLLSGKVNLELKTIAKLQSVLGETIMDINLSDSPIDHAEPKVVVRQSYVKSKPIVTKQTVGAQTYFSTYKIVG